MKRSVKDQIEEKIRRAPKGKLYVLSDFSDIGSYATIQKTVSLMVTAGVLEQVFKGIYKKPNYNSVLQRHIPSLPSDIALAYARKNNWKIVPSGDIALNQLGLTTQVPNRYQYISCGPTRKLVLENNQEIYFKHVEVRESNLSATSSLVIEALKAMGKEKVDEAILATIKSKLTDKQFIQLKKESIRARTWIRDLILKMEKIDVKFFSTN